MPNRDFPKWAVDLLSEHGEPYELSREAYQKLEACHREVLNHPRTLQEMADRQLSERYSRVRGQLKALLNYNRMLHAAPAVESPGKAEFPREVPAPLDGIPPASSTEHSDAGGSGIAPVFTGLWKHLYAFLWQQDFDLSHSQDHYKAVFATYRSEFAQKTIGSGKRKRAAYKMPCDSDAKSVRQGYHRQLERHLARQ